MNAVSLEIVNDLHLEKHLNILHCFVFILIN